MKKEVARFLLVWNFGLSVALIGLYCLLRWLWPPGKVDALHGYAVIVIVAFGYWMKERGLPRSYWVLMTLALGVISLLIPVVTLVVASVLFGITAWFEELISETEEHDLQRFLISVPASTGFIALVHVDLTWATIVAVTMFIVQVAIAPWRAIAETWN